MNTNSNPTSKGFLVVFMLQIVLFVAALVGVVLMVIAIKHNFSTSLFMSGLFTALIGSAVGVFLTLYSLRMQ